MELDLQKAVREMPGGHQMNGGAIISDCGAYRYLLWRRWPSLFPERIMNFVMLNPSTADGMDDDPTIRRCIGFAEREGCNGIRVLNVFAYRTPYPKELLRQPDPIGPENDKYLQSCRGGELVVLAWGAGAPIDRTRDVTAMLAWLPLWCFGKNTDGSPKHPLYLPKNAPLVPFGV